MYPSQKEVDLIKKFEGLALISYPDPASKLYKKCQALKITPYCNGYRKIPNWDKTSGAPWTIGWGHTSEIKAGMEITQAQAETFLKNDILVKISLVNKYVRVPLTQGQFDAVLDFFYNVKLKTVLSSTLLKLLNQNKYDLAAKEFNKFVYAGKTKLPGLVTRRKAETEMFLSK